MDCEWVWFCLWWFGYCLWYGWLGDGVGLVVDFVGYWGDDFLFDGLIVFGLGYEVCVVYVLECLFV